MSNDNRYDIIIFRTGAGGGTLAHHLAPLGQRILILERGDYVPREKANWDPKIVNVDAHYRFTGASSETVTIELHIGKGRCVLYSTGSPNTTVFPTLSSN